MDFTTNYCGMYWSDGTFQNSVSDGSSRPVNPLDAGCQQHDSDYHSAAKLSGEDRMAAEKAADDKFHRRTTNLGLKGKLYGNIVKHGNKVLRAAKRAVFSYDASVVKPVPATKMPVRLPIRTSDPSWNPVQSDWEDGDVVEAHIYDPKHPSDVVVKTIKKPKVSKPILSRISAQKTHIAETPNKPIKLLDPKLLPSKAAIRADQAIYKPLKKKKIKRSPSLLKLHLKYNPPKIKTYIDSTQ